MQETLSHNEHQGQSSPSLRKRASVENPDTKSNPQLDELKKEGKLQFEEEYAKHRMETSEDNPLTNGSHSTRTHTWSIVGGLKSNVVRIESGTHRRRSSLSAVLQRMHRRRAASSSAEYPASPWEVFTREGWLHRRGINDESKWRTEYCILQSGYLYYFPDRPPNNSNFKDSNEPNYFKPKGCIDLTNCSVTKTKMFTRIAKPHAFELIEAVFNHNHSLQYRRFFFSTLRKEERKAKGWQVSTSAKADMNGWIEELQKASNTTHHLSSSGSYPELEKNIKIKSNKKQELALAEFLEELGLEEYLKIFLEHKIDMDTLTGLTDKHMEEMRIPIGCRIKIQNKIAVFQKEMEFGGRHSSVYIKDVEHLNQCLGEGRGGSVYLGLWQATTLVAMKAVTDYGSLKSEATLLKTLNHPNIVSFIGLYELDEELFIITEHMPKGSLLDVLRREDLPLQRLFEMAKGVAAGMNYLHSHQVVHRDLACRNLLVDEGYSIKIADFGLSRLLDKDDPNYTTRQKVMPFKWCSPESLTNKVFNFKSDVWSFGVTLWEMFQQGAEPYTDMSNTEVKTFVCNGGRLEQPQGCDNDLYQLMLSCWNANSGLRPSFKQIFMKLRTIEADVASRTNDQYLLIELSEDEDLIDLNNQMHQCPSPSNSSPSSPTEHLYEENITSNIHSHSNGRLSLTSSLNNLKLNKSTNGQTS